MGTAGNPFMARAIEEARGAARRGEVPVGAIVVDVTDGEILASAGNEMRARRDPTAHAEMLAIRAAAQRIGDQRLVGCDLYVTLEPCPMCAHGIALARFRRLYFAAYDPKGGGVEHGARVFDQRGCNHRPEVYGGLAEHEAEELLRDFFSALR